jgi:methionine synthase I (cobalamin-dependent)
MGTRLIALGLDLFAGDPAFWNLSRPDAIVALHARDVAAGSEAVLTNTFGANRAWLARYGREGEVAAINQAAARLARAAAGPDRLVLGSIGPTACERPGACLEQAEMLVGAGVDALIFETFPADQQAVAAVEETRRAVSGPLLVSLVTWPEPVDDAARRLEDLGVWAVGGNCQLGMEPAVALAHALRRSTGLPLIVKPSAGRPGDVPFTPASFAAAATMLRELGPILVGGCCGTTEAHVAALRAAWYDSPESPDHRLGDPDASFLPSPDRSGRPEGVSR